MYKKSGDVYCRKNLVWCFYSDTTLSMGIIEPQANPLQLNTIEFIWDPAKNASIFIQVGFFNKDRLICS